jgi:RHS repeat-associated protein
VPRRTTAARWGGAPAVAAYELDANLRVVAEQGELDATADFVTEAFAGSSAASAAAAAVMIGARTTYGLDGRNNWTARSVAGVGTAFGRDVRDALVAIDGVTTGADARGAIHQEGGRVYTYDALGLLASVREPDGSGRDYQRDGLGRIVGIRDAATSQLVRVGWDGPQEVVRRQADGMVEATVAGEAPDELVVTLSSSGARRYYHQDRQGSVYLTTAASGAVDQWLGYDAYREVRVHDTAGRPIPAGAIASTFGYHGPPHDFVLGLVDMRARTYRTGLGQFLSPDPIGLAGGASLFAFVDSAPLAFRDPSGLAKEYRNALGDTLLLAHGDAFLYVRDPAASHPGYGWKGPARLQWKAQDGAWRALDPSSFARATQDALAWENDPEKGEKFDRINQSLQPITAVPQLVCGGTCANASLAGDLGAAAGRLWYGTDEPSIDLGDEDIAAQMAAAGPPSHPTGTRGAGTREVFSVGPFRPAASPLENHHGVLDIWAHHNIPGVDLILSSRASSASRSGAAQPDAAQA